MDTEDRGMPDTAGDLGGNDSVLIAEYDLAESRGPESKGTELRQEGERTSRRAGFAGTAEGRRIDIRGAVAMARAEKAKVKGFSFLTVGETTKVKGAAAIAVATDTVKLKKAGNLLSVAGREVSVGERGFVGFALAPRVEVHDGGKVLIGLVTAVIAGLAFGLGIGLSGMLGVTMLRRTMMARRH